MQQERFLSQTATGKNGMEKARDMAVVVATLAGASLSVASISAKKPPAENVALGVGAIALITIGLVTLINDVV